MSLLLIIIIGSALGYAASKTHSAGFGLWWDIYLGIAGSVFAHCFAFAAYALLDIFSRQDTVGINLTSILISVAGVFALISLARLYNGLLNKKLPGQGFGNRINFTEKARLALIFGELSLIKYKKSFPLALLENKWAANLRNLNRSSKTIT